MARSVAVPYATLHRFAVAEPGFGGTAPTIPVADCAPGKELQVDTGWMSLFEPDLCGKRRRCVATVYRLCAEGQLAHVRVLNAVRVARRDLDAFVEERRRNGRRPDRG